MREKKHGVGGRKITENSIPLKDEDFRLAQYIMVSPDKVERGSMDASGRSSIRFIKKYDTEDTRSAGFTSRGIGSLTDVASRLELFKGDQDRGLTMMSKASMEFAKIMFLYLYKNNPTEQEALKKAIEIG